MGLAAFRQGAVLEAHASLVDVQSSGRAKELLGQGVQMVRGQQQEKTADQERFERLKQLPYFMHINLDLVEAIYLIAATLLEIPYMAGMLYYMRSVFFKFVLTGHFNSVDYCILGQCKCSLNSYSNVVSSRRIQYCIC